MWRDVALLPVLLPQALWVAARARRLPEAPGPRSGRAGQGPTLRLLILGDSAAAGVGIAHQDQSLAGRLAADLARDHAVDWRLVARSGATARTALAMASALAESTEAAGGFDRVLVAIGVNDVKNGVRRADWTARCEALLVLLRTRLGARNIVVTGVPPLARFPLLPRPLRDVLGARAARFDASLRAVAARQGATHLPAEGLLDPDGMAADGFHPGAALHALWAAHAARAMRQA